MKIKMLHNHTDITAGKVYDAERIYSGVIEFNNDVGCARRRHYPDDTVYVEVKDEVIDEPEQLTLRDQFAIAVEPRPDTIGHEARAEWRYREADAMIEARKK